MRAESNRQGGIAGGVFIGACAGVLAIGLAATALADDPVPAGGIVPHAQALDEGSRCGSVVIRHCRVRRQAAAPGAEDTPAARAGAPAEWEAVQMAGPDSDEIVVSGERIRDPALKEVFDRAFGAPLAARGMHTRSAVAGARCTTVEGSGATMCSNGGNSLPALQNPLTDWTF